MRVEDIKRDLRPGDIIQCKGIKVTIKEVLFQDCYKDPYVEQRGGTDNSYIDTEFMDVNGAYHHWKSSQDGGSVIYVDEEKKKPCSEVFESLYKNTGKTLKDVVVELKGMGYSKNDILESILKILKDVTWEE